MAPTAPARLRSSGRRTTLPHSTRTCTATGHPPCKANVATTAERLIQQLNSKLRGWANYYRHVVSKKTFAYVDHQVFLALIAWINRRQLPRNPQSDGAEYVKAIAPRFP
ncbi:hypothetical protein KNO81_41125 [Paraburkholderia sediminicola]|nr:hypothetical protein [Paraburkholderia sediminicola]